MKLQLYILLGHIGSNAINCLLSYVRGILLLTSSALATINCKEYLQNKAH
jgi:hypothetical protein